MKNEWVHKCNHANRHQRAQSAHRFPKWQIGNRRGGKYLLKGEGGNVCGLGERILILLNQFVRFFLEPRYQKSRVFPCKLPSLISLFDMLHCTTTHTRDRAWGEQKVQSPDGSRACVPLSTVDYLIHSHVKQKAGRGGTQVERSPQAP